MKTFVLLLSLVSVSAFASEDAITFKCKSLDYAESVIATLSADKKVVTVETTAATIPVNSFSYVADLDSSYKPKVQGSARFIVRNSGFDKTRIIINAKMLNGESGKMRTEGNTDSYWSAYYSCEVNK